MKIINETLNYRLHSSETLELAWFLGKYLLYLAIQIRRHGSLRCQTPPWPGGREREVKTISCRWFAGEDRADEAQKLDGSELRDRLKILAEKYPRYGYPTLQTILRTEGLAKNLKRTYLIYSEEGLEVWTKKRKKLTGPRVPIVLPTKVNARWSIDFVSDQLANGKRFWVQSKPSPFRVVRNMQLPITMPNDSIKPT